MRQPEHVRDLRVPASTSRGAVRAFASRPAAAHRRTRDPAVRGFAADALLERRHPEQEVPRRFRVEVLHRHRHEPERVVGEALHEPPEHLGCEQLPLFRAPVDSRRRGHVVHVHRRQRLDLEHEERVDNCGELRERRSGGGEGTDGEQVITLRCGLGTFLSARK